MSSGAPSIDLGPRDWAPVFPRLDLDLSLRPEVGKATSHVALPVRVARLETSVVPRWRSRKRWALASAVFHAAAVAMMLSMPSGEMSAGDSLEIPVEIVIEAVPEIPESSSEVMPAAPEEIRPEAPVEAAIPETGPVPVLVEPSEPQEASAAAEVVSPPVAELRPSTAPQPKMASKPQSARPERPAEPVRKPRPVAPAEAGTAEPRRVAAPSQTSAADVSAFRAAVAGRLQGAKRYPESARARGASGVVVVAFSLDGSGHLVSVNVARSSGQSDLDAEAIATVRRAAPFPPPPAGAARSFSVPLGFRLR